MSEYRDVLLRYQTVFCVASSLFAVGAATNRRNRRSPQCGYIVPVKRNAYKIVNTK